MKKRSTDFGGIVRRRPRMIVHARTEGEITEALGLAASQHLSVTIQGRGHSCNGQSLSQGGLLLLRRPSSPAVRVMGEGGLAEISAGCSWFKVERLLNKMGRTAPALADFLGLSVGGTVSVGGYGADSIVHGGQVDNVESLRLILPNGNVCWCSSGERPDLFKYSLAGLGQTGVIDKVVIRTQPYLRYTSLFTYEHKSLGEMIESFEWMTDESEKTPGLFKGLCSRNRCISTYGSNSSTLAEALSARSPAGHALSATPVRRKLVCRGYRYLRSLAVSVWCARFANCNRIWSDYIFDLGRLRSFAEFLSKLIAEGAFDGRLKSIYLLGIRTPRTPAPPFAAAGHSREAVQFGIGLYSMVPKGESPIQSQVMRALRRCLEKALELQGRPYLYGWHELRSEQLSEIYGEDYARFLRLKQALDPSGSFQPNKILTPGVAKASR